MSAPTIQTNAAKALELVDAVMLRLKQKSLTEIYNQASEVKKHITAIADELKAAE